MVNNEIVALAETVKELVRIFQCMPNYTKLELSLQQRMEDVYKKATLIKNSELKKSA